MSGKSKSKQFLCDQSELDKQIVFHLWVTNHQNKIWPTDLDFAVVWCLSRQILSNQLYLDDQIVFHVWAKNNQDKIWQSSFDTAILWGLVKKQNKTKKNRFSEYRLAKTTHWIQKLIFYYLNCPLSNNKGYFRSELCQ